MTTALLGTAPSGSPFAGTDVCQQAGLALPPQARRPCFDDDLWDFTHVIGLPVSMALATRRFDFTAIIDSRWRLVAKESIFAMLTPRHEAVAPLPRAYRTPMHLNTANGRLIELTRFLNWVTGQGLTSLSLVDSRHCEAYLAHRRYVVDEHGTVVGELGPSVRRSAAQAVIDLLNYRELFTADRPDPALRPWGGATASAIAEMPSGRTMNKTPPLSDDVLQPMLAAALYLVSDLGPHAITLHQQIKEADQWSVRRAREAGRSRWRAPVAEFTQLLERYQHDQRPLPSLPDYVIAERIATGWPADDPLLAVAGSPLARQAGFTQFSLSWLDEMRKPLEAAVAAVGIQPWFARDAAFVEHADGQGQIPWSLPLHRLQAVALVGIVRTAAATVIAAVSGMRASELMELQIGCPRPPEVFGHGMLRYRLASKLIKGQPLGGTRDEWVVIEPAYQAVEIVEQLHDDAAEGALLFGRFAFSIRYQWFRNWVNGPFGQRLGLAPIPDTPVNLRALRRTLAIELAYRPGGVLATKIHLKHVAVATTEGYASRPAAPKPSCSPRSTDTRANATSTCSGRSSATTSRAPCPPGPAPATSPSSSPTSTRNSTPQTPLHPRPSAATERSSTCSPNGPKSCTWASRTTAGSPTPPAPSASSSPAPPPPTNPSSACVTPPAAPKPPTTPATDPSGPTTPTERRPSSANSAPPAAPNEPASKPNTTAQHARHHRDRHRSRSPPVRLTPEQRHHNETKIRAAMDRLLLGDLPPGGRCDIKTLARESGIDRTAFYGTRPYNHLREEFEARLAAIREAGDTPDPRDAQITRLKAEITTLKERLTRREESIQALTDFRDQALSRLAEQHDEILHLRRQADRDTRIRRLPTRTNGTAGIGPCS